MGENASSLHAQNRILVPLRGCFQIFRKTPPPFYTRVPLPGRKLVEVLHLCFFPAGNYVFSPFKFTPLFKVMSLSSFIILFRESFLGPSYRQENKSSNINKTTSTNQCKRVPDLRRPGSVKIKRYYAKD